MLQGRPLLATAADNRLFVDRSDELAQLQRSVDNGFNVAMYGDRGSGKTSLLHQLEYRQRSKRRMVYVDATGVEDVYALVHRVRDKVAPLPPVNQIIEEQQRSMYQDAVGALPGALSGIVSADVQSLGRADPTVILVDASAAGDAAYGLFGRLRDDLWQLEHRWVVAVDSDDWHEVHRPPADAFFDIVIALSRFDDDQLVEVLTRRATDLDTGALAAIAERSDGNPRRALELVRQALITGRPIAEVLEGRAGRQTAAAELGRAHSMLLAELEDSSEAVSPSDEKLLQRLGWTRERAGQVLRDLETHNLVTSTQERQPRGRPRKLYRPNTQYES